ncbi:MAG TPA: glycosyltransferase [Vicinamibacterales bacterium]|jgi:glycosyltransferase involved in cell wall biosynthesis
MSAEPLVTIGCAVYNGEETLERALSSVVAQDYANCEVLVSDDCSTDRSLAICEAVARRDPRVRIIRNARNIGLHHNFNLLFREAKGKYFMWADQDDIREKTFVRKAVAALEADPDAVVCHSYTGAFIGDPGDVKLIVTLEGVSGVASPVRRYLKFLRRYSDTVIYGLIRSDALRRTRLWRSDLGSANALLFELLLAGKFIHIPEVLYFYSGRGVRNRPSPKEEYGRMNLGRDMPRYYFPFLVLALNQTDGIRRSALGWFEKVVLIGALWIHVSVIALTKLVYRLLHRVSFGRLPAWLTEFCGSIVESRSHLIFLNNADRDETLFPKAWALKGIKG